MGRFNLQTPPVPEGMTVEEYVDEWFAVPAWAHQDPADEVLGHPGAEQTAPVIEGESAHVHAVHYSCQDDGRPLSLSVQPIVEETT